MFYSGLAVELYDLFFQELDQQEYQFYYKHIVDSCAPALEIGCGTGRVLLPLLKQGLLVEGFDQSSEMLKICMRKAASYSINPVLYRQRMQELSLPKRYGCLYCPLGTFGQVASRKDAYDALQHFYTHLLPNGTLIIYLYLPWYNAPEFGSWHEHEPRMLHQDASLRVWEKGVHDPVEQQLFMRYRYEVWHKDTCVKQEIKDMTIRWYSRYEFECMLEYVGFRDIQVLSGYEDNGPADVMLFVAKK